MLEHQAIDVVPIPVSSTTFPSQGTQLLAPGNIGLLLVLFTQDRCTYCREAVEVFETLEIEHCAKKMYDMTGLSEEKVNAIHQAVGLYERDQRGEQAPGEAGVYETPAFVLFCSENPVSVLVKWFTDKELSQPRRKRKNKKRIFDFFTKSIAKAEGICALRPLIIDGGVHHFAHRDKYNEADASECDEHDELCVGNESTEYQEPDVTGAMHNVYWKGKKMVLP
jgi:hypothetical protein